MKIEQEDDFHFDEDESEQESMEDKPSIEDSISDDKTQSGDQLKERKKTKKSAKRTASTARLKKQIEELEAALEEYESEISELKDKNLRLHAEFENFKKRQERELYRIRKYAGEEILLDILSILDDLERTLKATEDQEGKRDKPCEHESIREGVELIYNKFLKILEKWEVHPIEAVGKPFDPDLHEAMMMRAGDDSEANIVLEEFEKGYTFRDKVLRHSKVVVSE